MTVLGFGWALFWSFIQLKLCISPSAFKFRTLVQQEHYEVGEGLWHTTLFLCNIILLFPFWCVVFWNPKSKLVLNTSLLSWASGYHLAISVQCWKWPKDMCFSQIVFSWAIGSLANGRNLVLTWKRPWAIDPCPECKQRKNYLSSWVPRSMARDTNPQMNSQNPCLIAVIRPPKTTTTTKNPTCNFGWVKIGQKVSKYHICWILIVLGMQGLH